MSDATIEMEAAPETASFRHYRRMMWQTIRTRHEEAVIHAHFLGLGDDEARAVAARAVRGDIRAFMSEMLTLAPVPAILEFLAVGRDWGVAGERLLEQTDVVMALVDSAYPRPTWTDLSPLARQAAEDDAVWSAWTESWATVLRATGPAAEAALATAVKPANSRMKEQNSALRRWAPWLASAATILSVTTVVVVATRE